jgi:hypothetical protein
VCLGGLPTFVPHVLEMFKIHFLLKKEGNEPLPKKSKLKLKKFISARRFELSNFHGKKY